MLCKTCGLTIADGWHGNGHFETSDHGMSAKQYKFIHSTIVVCYECDTTQQITMNQA